MRKLISAICIITLIISMTSPAFAAVKDTKAPTITKTSPVDKATDIMKESELVIRFSENIKKGKAIDNISINSVSGNEVAYTYEIKDNLLILSPKAKLAYHMDYTVTIPSGAVKDAAGNSLKKAYAFDFITEKDPKSKPIEVTDGITYDIGLQATLQGEFSPALQGYLIQYLEMLGIKAKITKVTKVSN